MNLHDIEKRVSKASGIDADGMMENLMRFYDTRLLERTIRDARYTYYVQPEWARPTINTYRVAIGTGTEDLPMEVNGVFLNT